VASGHRGLIHIRFHPATAVRQSLLRCTFNLLLEQLSSFVHPPLQVHCKPVVVFPTSPSRCRQDRTGLDRTEKERKGQERKGKERKGKENLISR